MHQLNLYRILDANCNRTVEGLRVVEDICRFVFDSEPFTEQLKSLRHRITDAIYQIDPSGRNLIAGRDSDADVGENILPELETNRAGYYSLVIANFRRAQEATRVLEETSKLLGVNASAIFKKIRYELYSLEKEILTQFPRTAFRDIDLYVVTDQKLSKGRTIEEVVTAAIAGGAMAIQLRDKETSTKQLLELGHRARQITCEKKVLFIINDRIDIAIAVDADGVHLGQDDLPIATARALLGYDKIIGVSVSTIEQAIQAEQAGADYLGLGPIFTTPTKPDAGTGLELEFIRLVREKINIPLVAIGGINAENVAEVIQAGADCAAVVSAVVSADDIASATRNLVAKIKEAKNQVNNAD
ncbi:MAG: thiamine phosphate synthase [bacterium]|nr:thiamine phosphate synthase [bacterium]